MQSVHISDVLSYKTCRRAWDWSSPLRQNLEPAKLYAPFFTGQAVHAAMEMFYREGVPFDETATAFIKSHALQVEAAGLVQSFEEDAIEDQSEIIFGMLWHYNLWRSKYAGSFADREFEFLPQYTEYEFEVPIYNPEGKKSNRVTLKGRVDNIARHRQTGKLWIWEFKTCRSLQERVALLPFDEQASAYLSAAQEFLGEPVEGILYTLMRKKSPSKPRLLQSGQLSNAKNIDTTYEAFYMHCCAHYHLDPNDPATKGLLLQRHGDVINELLGKPNKFFWRVPLRRTTEELRVASGALWQVALEMVNPLTPVWPHGGFHCQFCRFRVPCSELNLGILRDKNLAEVSDDYRPRTGYYGPQINLGEFITDQ